MAWVEYRKVPNLITAEMWKDALEAEGLPTMIRPEGDVLCWGPKGREHVADEILRKL